MPSKKTTLLTAPAVVALIAATALGVYLYQRNGILDAALVIAAISAAMALILNQIGSRLWSAAVARNAVSGAADQRTVIVDDALLNASVPRATTVLYMLVPPSILAAWIALLVGVVRLLRRP